MNEGNAFLSKLILTLTIWILILIKQLPFILYRKSIEHAEFYESVIEGSVEEPHPYRSLTSEEAVILKKESDCAKNQLRNLISSIFPKNTVFLIGFCLTVWAIFAKTIEMLSKIDIPTQVLFWIFLIMIGFFVLVDGAYRRERELHYDLGQAVWRVRGKMIQELSDGGIFLLHRQARVDLCFRVRRVRFRPS